MKRFLLFTILSLIFLLVVCCATAGQDGKDGITPTIEISEDGYWVINGEKTTITAVGQNGKDGTAPTIEICEDGYWVINGEKTTITAIGQNGKDGITPTIEISEDGYWVINGEKTTITAVGQNGKDGTAPTIEISEDGYWVINGTKTEYKAHATEEDNTKNLLRLPEQYDLVVGDTFELFYKSITFCANSDTFDYSVRLLSGKNLGKAYARKYIYTPTSAEIGTHTLEITLWNNEGDILDIDTVKLNVIAPPSSPDEEKVILIIGDSLTAGGTWASELHRRLTAQGGSPAGLGLTNISFIGSKSSNGVNYEGYSGWNFSSFTTANQRNDFMILSGDFSDKSDALDQHSTYRDSNNQVWKIEWVTATEMKIICSNVSGVLPSTEGGILTHVSGGQNHGDIIYTSARKADANPFWNEAKGKNDFISYAQKHGKEKIDEVILFMGWNEHSRTPAVFKERARTLIDSILADYPDCHITLVGLQTPSRNGFANNYGTTWPWFPMLEKIFAFEDAYRELAAEQKYENRLSVVSIAGQYDSEYNEVKSSIAANNRNPTTEVIGTNGVHPSTYGYLQIADAIYRHMCVRLST